MKFIKIFIVTLFLGLAFSCEEFEELNQNPNEPTEVSSDVLFPSAIRQSVNANVIESFLLGNNAAQLTAKTLRTEVDAYNWNAFPTVWEELYESLTDVYVIERQALEDGNQLQEGAAVILRSWIFSVLTNAYGDIPYTEAIAGDDNNFTPVYDTQEFIYGDILSELERATGLLSSGNGVIGGDILLGNDASGWVKFANSLRLRLLLLGSNKIANADQQIAQIFAEGNIITSNDDNVVLDYLSTFPNEFPLIPLKTGDFDAVALSETALNVMSSYSDPRLARYARPDNDDYQNPEFTGAANGTNSPNCSKAGSRLGARYYIDQAQTTATELGIATANGIIITYAEVQFILAEAAAKGWINADEEQLYRSGIEASMDYYQVDFASFGFTDFADYYTNSGVAYNVITDIWEQKWLAMFFTGLEPYFEVRRWYFEANSGWAGIPFLSPPCENLNNDRLPQRFLYPGEEQSLNSVNYQEAVERLPDADQRFNAPVWIVE